MFFLATCVYLQRNLLVRLTTQRNATQSLYASSTSAHLRLLAGPFDQGFNIDFFLTSTYFIFHNTEKAFVARS